MMKIYNGESVAHGIVAGKVVLFVSEAFVNVEPEKIKPEKVKAELRRFENSIIRSKKQLQTIKNKVKKTLGVSEAGIFHSQLLILEDKYLLDKIYINIEDNLLNAEYSVIKSIGEFKEELSKSKSQYLKERVIDLEDIKKRFLKNLGISMNEKEFFDPENHSIAVAQTVTASDAIELINLGVKGLVLEKAGTTSHAAILARAMGVPTIVGVKNIINLILEEKKEDKNFNKAVLDAYSGKLILDPDENTLERYLKKKKRKDRERAKICDEKPLPACTSDGEKINIFANLGAKFNIKNVACQGALGVGLYRTEFQYMLRNSFPDEEALFYDYSELLKALGDKVLTIRLLDVGGDKFLPYYDHPSEKNPELGERSIRFLFRNEHILRTQLRAILRASVYGSPKIMIPMISSCSEIKKVLSILEEEKKNLKKEKISFREEEVQVGMMVEIPAAVINIEKLAHYSDFFSIGSNDLIQYTLGVDRENYAIKEYYNPSHPAVISMIKYCIDMCVKTEKELSICGEMGSEIKYIPLLIGMGLKNLSMNINNIKESKDYIRSLSMKECKDLANKVMDLDELCEIDCVLKEFKEKHYTEED